MTSDLTKGSRGAPVIDNGDGAYGVVLPCSVDHFGEFISGLLGKKQVMDGFEDGHFEIGPQEIANIYHLITQRVNAQNEASLVALSIKVIYDNGNAVTHNTVAAFTSHHPIEACHPVEVILSFTFVISFKSKTVPEKQSVDVSFVAQHHEWRDEPRRHVVEGSIEYRIEYTERTWASDIAALIRNHAKTIIGPTSRTRKWLRSYSDELTSILAIVLFVATVGGWSWYTAANVASLTSSSAFVPFFAKSIFIFCALGGFLVALSKIFEYNLFLGRSSFISLTDSDRTWTEKARRRQARTLYVAIGGWLMSVVASVVASFAYASLA